MTTILVVDDEFDLQQTICATLEMEGYTPVCAGDGRAALELLRQQLPDLVLTDVMMPYMTGYDLVDAIRKLPGGERLPVLLMSSIDPDLHPRGTWNGLLPKPFTYDTLMGQVRKLLPANGSSPAA